MNMGGSFKISVAAFLLFIIITLPIHCNAIARQREFYAIKIYHLKNHTQHEQTSHYLKEAYLPALHRMGIKHVGVFEPADDDSSYGRRIYVLIPFQSLTALTSLDQQLEKDQKYKQDGSTYLNTRYNEPPYERIETIILKAFPEHPVLTLPKLNNTPSDRIYELRSYESPTEALLRSKIDMFNYGAELSIFKKLNFNAVFYGEVLAGPKMPNLMYLTTYEDMKSRDAHWKAFFNDPKWEELVGMKKYQHNVSHADILFLHPADYSDI